MNLHHNLRRNRKGIGTVFAMVFFLLIVMVVFASFIAILNQNTGLEQTLAQTRQMDIDRAKEQLTINLQPSLGLYSNFGTNSLVVNCVFNNTGTLPIKLKHLWVQDNTKKTVGDLALSMDIPQGDSTYYSSSPVIFPGTIQATDQLIFWFVTARGNQLTLGQSNGAASQADFNQQLSGMFGDFLVDYHSVQWASVTTTNGVSVTGPWQTGWIIPTTVNIQKVAFRLNVTYYGSTSIRIDNDTNIWFNNLQQSSVVFENSQVSLITIGYDHFYTGVYPTLYISNYVQATNALSLYNGHEITAEPSTNPIPTTLYFSTIQNWTAADSGSWNNWPITPYGSPSPIGYPLNCISPNAQMSLVLYGMSPSNYAQTFSLFAAQSRPISIQLNQTSGVVGTSVAVSGTGFAANSPISLTFDSTILTTSITTSPAGGFTTTFIVPSATHGIHTVTATDSSSSNNAAIATFTVAPNLITSPTSGPSGTSVTASGTGFVANSPITVTFNGTTVSTSPSTVMTDATGSFFSATFIVPSSTAGVKTINVADADGNSDTASYTVTAQSITLTPTSGNIGTITTVSGSNFLPSSPLTVTYNGVTVGTSVSTGSGALPSGVTFPVPTSTFGSNVVRVTDGFGNYATATFSVTTSIRLSPTRGPVGTPVAVSGQGFGALKTITVTFAGTAIVTSPSPVTTDNYGSFDASFNVPAGSSTSSVAGAKTVVASDSSSPPNSASATFTVTPYITLNPTTGNAGTVVTVSGTGYGASRTMTIKFDATTQTTSPTMVTTTAYGTFSCTFTVPTSIGGSHNVTGIDSSSNTDTEIFNITPTITLNPTSGNVGSSVSVSGAGFGNSKAITATFNGASISLSGTTSTGSTGSFNGAIFTVPISTAGVRTIVITDADSNFAAANFTVNTVVQPITVTLSNSAPSAAVTINGGYASPATFAADGNPHFITMVGGSPFNLSFSNSGNIRDGFSVSSAFSSTSSSYTASTTPISVAAYEQVQNTFSVSGVSGSDSVALTGTYLGTGSSTIGTLNSGDSWSTSSWSDYNKTITFPATTTNSGLIERWTIGNPYTTTALTAGGNTYSQWYTHQCKLTFDVSANVKGDTSANIVIVNSRGQTLPFTTDWLNSGVDSLTYAFQSPIASSGSPSNTQYVWSSTNGLGQTLQTNTFTVNAVGTVSGVYTTQYKLTFAQSGLDNSATGTVLTVNSAGQTYNNLPFTTWMNNGSIVTYSYNSPVTSSTTGKQFRLNSVTGSASPVTVNSPATLTGNYVVQWQVTFSVTGVDGSAGSNTVLTVGSTNYAYNALPTGVYVDNGTTFSWAFPVSGGSGKQFVQTSSSGSSPILVAGTYSATYKTQYQVTFAQSGLDSSATGTVLTVGSTTYTYSQLPQTNIWVDNGTTYSFSTSVTTSDAHKTFGYTSVAGLSSPIAASGTVTGKYGSLILRPSAAGTTTGLSVNTGSNYAATDETSSDGDTTYVYRSSTTAAYDTYIVPDTTLSGLTIQSITVHIVARENTYNGYARPYILIGGTGYYPSSYNFLTTSYAEYTNTWTTNPNTSTSWTWANINSLEIGVQMYAQYSTYAPRCTQAWVEIIYTPA
jgi:hypothetical protein